MKFLYLIIGLFYLFNTFAFADDFEKAKAELLGDEFISNHLSANSLCFKSISNEKINLESDEKIFYHALFLNCKILSIKLGFDFDNVDSNLSFCQKDQFNKDFSDTIFKLKKINNIKGFNKDILEKIKDWTLFHSYKYKEVCTDKILKNITPEGLVDNTGLPPNEKMDKNVRDYSRQNKKRENFRGPEAPENESKVINK